MTQEEKQLLLKDISARLPYRVKCGITKKGVVRELKPMDNGISMPVNQVCDVTVKKTLNTDIINDFDNDNIVLKPYLRPLSSMTLVERIELKAITKGAIQTIGLEDIVVTTDKGFDYLNAHHFDYRGLIPMGLALGATRDMYKTE